MHKQRSIEEKDYFDFNSDSCDSESDSDVDDNDFNLEKELKRIGLRMNRDLLTDLLKVLQQAGHPELPNTAEKLPDTPKTTEISRCEDGEDFYGLEKSLLDIINRGENLPDIIELDVGADGAPLSKSGNKKLCPIVGRIRNHSSLPPFLIGCYHGIRSPTSSKPFLQPFVNEFKKFEDNYLSLNGKMYKLILRCIICDTPGRCLVRGSQLYNGYYGCC